VTRPTLDASDRRIVGITLVLLLAFLLVCIVVGGGLGAGVLMFRLVSGG
jgi:hypothetical protein